MDYDLCLRSALLDLESWAIVLTGFTVSVFLMRFEKRAFAVTCFLTTLVLATSWAYFYYELNCVEHRYS
ncbi:MAG: hypothetical protein ACRBB0_02650 [Pelagimonas sp.]|uniref:hypothetical protein n=1 Tax=Pelagimonas sp. TaxID=2073170 RepID=UPI003D6B27A8